MPTPKPKPGKEKEVKKNSKSVPKTKEKTSSKEYSNFNNAILNYKQERIKIRYQKNFSDFVKAHKSYIY